MKKLIFSFGSALFLAACNSTSEGELSLNNGQKWVVNAEMKPHLEQSERILNDYLTQKGADYEKLAADLKVQNDQLIKSCTMKGKSHDVLHQWLHPHMALIENLSEEKDPKQAASIVEELEQSFKTYQNYFQ
ncbi:MAG: hypothetical protein IPK21_03040 [Haliscomenobacter sp.]|nr:hypothetical protein [Haliscomenobacter sp.]